MSTSGASTPPPENSSDPATGEHSATGEPPSMSEGHEYVVDVESGATQRPAEPADQPVIDDI